MLVGLKLSLGSPNACRANLDAFILLEVGQMKGWSRNHARNWPHQILALNLTAYIKVKRSFD